MAGGRPQRPRRGAPPWTRRRPGRGRRTGEGGNPARMPTLGDHVHLGSDRGVQHRASRPDGCGGCARDLGHRARQRDGDGRRPGSRRPIREPDPRERRRRSRPRCPGGGADRADPARLDHGRQQRGRHRTAARRSRRPLRGTRGAVPQRRDPGRRPNPRAPRRFAGGVRLAVGAQDIRPPGRRRAVRRRGRPPAAPPGRGRRAGERAETRHVAGRRLRGFRRCVRVGGRATPTRFRTRGRACGGRCWRVSRASAAGR